MTLQVELTWVTMGSGNAWPNVDFSVDRWYGNRWRDFLVNINYYFVKWVCKYYFKNRWHISEGPRCVVCVLNVFVNICICIKLLFVSLCSVNLCLNGTESITETAKTISSSNHSTHITVNPRWSPLCCSRCQSAICCFADCCLVTGCPCSCLAVAGQRKCSVADCPVADCPSCYPVVACPCSCLVTGCPRCYSVRWLPLQRFRSCMPFQLSCSRLPSLAALAAFPQLTALVAALQPTALAATQSLAVLTVVL